jgi:hypothetical protein
LSTMPEKKSIREHKKMGRPLKVFSRKAFIALCKIQCTGPEVASAFECDEDTVNAWCKRTFGQTFSAVFDRYRGQGNISLRRKQNQIALQGNVKMLIWLGKNRLGQSDKQDVNLSGSVRVIRDTIK